MDKELTSLDQLRMMAERSMRVIERAAIPAGAIVIWSGQAGAIPEGWTLCDGENGAPDLRDRFVLDAGDTCALCYIMKL